MKKKTFVVLTVLSVVMCCIGFDVHVAAFEDVQGHWAQESIEKWEKHEIVKGFGNNRFEPNGQMTRAEIATVISRLVGLTKKADLSAFSDIGENDWYKESFEKCVAAGIFNGDGNNLTPNSPVTREMFFTLLARTFDIPGNDSLIKEFDDSETVSDWAKESTYAMINNGYVKGLTETEIAPKQSITRASVIVLIDRIVKNYVTEEMTVLDESNSGISIIKADNCLISDGYVGTLLFEQPNVTASFKGTDAQNIIVVSSGVTLIDVPQGSTVVTRDGAQNTVVNGVSYDANNRFVVAGQNKEEKEHGDKAEDKTENKAENKTADEKDMPAVILDNISALPGEEAEIKVTIKNNRGIFGAILNFEFDSKLELTDAVSGHAFSALDMTKPGKYASNCNFVWDGLDEPAQEDGIILTLHFTVSPDAASGEKLEINCSYMNGDIVDYNFEELDVTVINGSITVK